AAALSVNADRIFLADPDSKRIEVLALPELTPLKTFDLPFSPRTLAHGAHDRLYVSGNMFGESGGRGYQFAAATGQLVNTFQTQSDYGTLYRTSPDGNRLYAMNRYL